MYSIVFVSHYFCFVINLPTNKPKERMGTKCQLWSGSNHYGKTLETAFANFIMTNINNTLTPTDVYLHHWWVKLI